MNALTTLIIGWVSHLYWSMDVHHATHIIFWSDLHDLFYVYYYVCLVFLSFIAKGLAICRLGGDHLDVLFGIERYSHFIEDFDGWWSCWCFRSSSFNILGYIFRCPLPFVLYPDISPLTALYPYLFLPELDRYLFFSLHFSPWYLTLYFSLD